MLQLTELYRPILQIRVYSLNSPYRDGKKSAINYSLRLSRNTCKHPNVQYQHGIMRLSLRASNKASNLAGGNQIRDEHVSTSTDRALRVVKLKRGETRRNAFAKIFEFEIVFRRGTSRTTGVWFEISGYTRARARSRVERSREAMREDARRRDVLPFACPTCRDARETT